jgi:hypothetical protein
LSKDYRNLHHQIAGDLSAAATSASLAQGARRKKIRLSNSDLPSAIPAGSTISIESVAIGKLVMGDIICVTLGQGPQIRRFLRLKMTKSDTLIMTTHEGLDTKEALPKSALVGRVVEAEAGGAKWNPGKQNPFKRFWSKLTEYGTHKPFGLG